MNIFYLSKNPVEAAAMHCDKHCVKMLTEYAQMLSTAHRVLDGVAYEDRTSNGRKIMRYHHDDELLYKASHINHPSNVWLRASSEHYGWLFVLWTALGLEYRRRYDNKNHASFSRLYDSLCKPPLRIPHTGFTAPPQAMPDHCKIEGDTVRAYRYYYITEKARFARWKNGKNYLDTWRHDEYNYLNKEVA